jgi:hypothetical protein
LLRVFVLRWRFTPSAGYSSLGQIRTAHSATHY